MRGFQPSPPPPLHVFVCFCVILCLPPEHTFNFSGSQPRLANPAVCLCGISGRSTLKHLVRQAQKFQACKYKHQKEKDPQSFPSLSLPFLHFFKHTQIFPAIHRLSLCMCPGPFLGKETAENRGGLQKREAVKFQAENPMIKRDFMGLVQIRIHLIIHLDNAKESREREKRTSWGKLVRECCEKEAAKRCPERFLVFD